MKEDRQPEAGDPRSCVGRLPATAAAATAAAVATAATTTAAAATTTEATTAAATATTAAALALLRLVDAQRSAVELLAIHVLDRSLSFGIRAHLDEGEAARAARLAIAGHQDALDGPAIGRERVAQGVFSGFEIEVSDVELGSHGENYLFP
jgi:hypothetical protein